MLSRRLAMKRRGRWSDLFFLRSFSTRGAILLVFRKALTRFLSLNFPKKLELLGLTSPTKTVCLAVRHCPTHL
jgi:hypothetical protein